MKPYFRSVRNRGSSLTTFSSSAHLLRASVFLTLLGACGSPAPPFPQGAVSFSVSPPSGKSCNRGGFSKSLGMINETEVASLVDRQNGASIRCKISPLVNGSGFRLDASIKLGDDQLSITGDIASLGTSRVQVSVTTQETKSTLTSGTPSATGGAEPCMVSIPDSPSETLGVSAGKIWASLTCTDLRDYRDTSESVCGISDSYIFFDNCENLVFLVQNF